MKKILLSEVTDQLRRITSAAMVPVDEGMDKFYICLHFGKAESAMIFNIREGRRIFSSRKALAYARNTLGLKEIQVALQAGKEREA